MAQYSEKVMDHAMQVDKALHADEISMFELRIEEWTGAMCRSKQDAA